MGNPIRQWQFSLQGKMFCHMFNLNYGLRGGPWLHYDAGKGIYHAAITGHDARMYLSRSHQAQRGRFRYSVVERLEGLAYVYSLDTVDVADGDVVVDVGANIGEIGMYFRLLRNTKIKYYALEPVAKEAICCRLNNPGAKVLQQALWKEDGRVRFYKSVSYNDDSSIFEPGKYDSVREIPVVTLDTFCREHGCIGRIKILKVETEGAEPEVLEGAERILDRIEYVAADLGPERGPKQEATLPAVVDFLYARGFKLIMGSGHGRGNFLFRNTRIAGG